MTRSLDSALARPLFAAMIALSLGALTVGCSSSESDSTPSGGDQQSAPSEPPSAPLPAPDVSPPAADPTPEASAEAEPVDLLHAVEAEVVASSAFRDSAVQVEHLVDGELETAWNSASGDLEGAWLELQVPSEANVTALDMTAGFTKVSRGRDLFTGNHRVRRVRVTRDGAEVGTYELDTDSRELQRLPVNGPGGRYRIELIELIAGGHQSWREACVSEIRLLGRAPSAEAGTHQPTARIATEAERGGPSDGGPSDGGPADGGSGPAAPTLAEADGLRLTELATCTGVENATPVDPRQRFTQGEDERVYCFVRVQNQRTEETTLFLGWEEQGQTPSGPGREVRVPARPRFGTYAFLTTGRRSGPWRCVIRTASGEEIGSIDFEILEPSEP